MGAVRIFLITIIVVSAFQFLLQFAFFPLFHRMVNFIHLSFFGIISHSLVALVTFGVTAITFLISVPTDRLSA